MIDPYEVIRRALESDVVRVTMGNGARVDVLTGAFCGLCIRTGIHDVSGAVKCACWCHDARTALRDAAEPEEPRRGGWPKGRPRKPISDASDGDEVA